MGSLPAGSDYAGEDRMALKALNQKMKQAAFLAQTPQEVEVYIKEAGNPDLIFEEEGVYFHHRIIENTDVYYLYGIHKGTVCSFRSIGIPVVYNPWTGEKRKVADFEQEGGRTILKMPFSEKEVFLVAFEKDKEAEKLSVLEEKYDRVFRMTGTWECDILPTMDNQYGDYQLPGGDYFIGPQARELEYGFGDTPEAVKEWRTEQVTFGTQFFVCRNHEDEEEKFIQMTEPSAEFEAFCFSWKEGVKNDAGYQGSYHGLKGKVSDDFLTMGEKKIEMAGSSSTYVGKGVWYFFTTVFVPEKIEQVIMDMGEQRPDSIFLNHRRVTGEACSLQKGTNTILLKYTHPGRTHFILRTDVGFLQTKPLVTQWYENPQIIPFDAYPDLAEKYCWYRFIAPPGSVAAKVRTKGETSVWVNGRKVPFTDEEYVLPWNNGQASVIWLRIKQERGFYGCAAILEPVSFRTVTGKIQIPISEEKEGLQFYSGGLKLTGEIEITTTGRIGLELPFPECAVRVCINGKEAGVVLTSPQICDISKNIRTGTNKVEVYVYNSLHNHMKTIPTNFNYYESPGKT